MTFQWISSTIKIYFLNGKILCWSFIFFFTVNLISCTDNNKKIIGDWVRTVVESDGGKYVETYTFFNEEYDNRVEYSYIPQDYSHIGYQANGRWDLDLLGNLKLYLDPKSATAVYNF